jgi:hypothetical protein
MPIWVFRNETDDDDVEEVDDGEEANDGEETGDDKLAFATTTTVLSYIRRPRTFENEDAVDHSRKLREVNALAAVLSRGTEIVAVVKKKNSESKVRLVTILKFK